MKKIRKFMNVYVLFVLIATAPVTTGKGWLSYFADPLQYYYDEMSSFLEDAINSLGEILSDDYHKPIKRQ